MHDSLQRLLNTASDYLNRFTVVIQRHGDTHLPTPNGGDMDRELNTQGVAQAANATTKLTGIHLQPSLFLSSPARYCVAMLASHDARSPIVRLPQLYTNMATSDDQRTMNTAYGNLGYDAPLGLYYRQPGVTTALARWRLAATLALVTQIAQAELVRSHVVLVCSHPVLCQELTRGLIGDVAAIRNLSLGPAEQLVVVRGKLKSFIVGHWDDERKLVL